MSDIEEYRLNPLANFDTILVRMSYRLFNLPVSSWHSLRKELNGRNQCLHSFDKIVNLHNKTATFTFHYTKDRTSENPLLVVGVLISFNGVQEYQKFLHERGLTVDLNKRSPSNEKSNYLTNEERNLANSYEGCTPIDFYLDHLPRKVWHSLCIYYNEALSKLNYWIKNHTDSPDRFQTSNQDHQSFSFQWVEINCDLPINEDSDPLIDPQFIRNISLYASDIRSIKYVNTSKGRLKKVRTAPHCYRKFNYSLEATLDQHQVDLVCYHKDKDILRVEAIIKDKSKINNEKKQRKGPDNFELIKKGSAEYNEGGSKAFNDEHDIKHIFTRLWSYALPTLEKIAKKHGNPSLKLTKRRLINILTDATDEDDFPIFDEDHVTYLVNHLLNNDFIIHLSLENGPSRPIKDIVRKLAKMKKVFQPLGKYRKGAYTIIPTLLT
ncbi:MAG: hypothetical protein AB8G05_00760 [Oligoflexales bacterium]